jgi:hypothetical protein
LKQIGLALHNYHDVYSTFPLGVAPVYGAANNYGTGTWKYRLLPHLEQAAMFNTPVLSSWRGDAVASPTAWEDFRVPVYHCPSSATKETRTSSQCTNCYESESHDYVGISGANPDPAGRAGSDVRFQTCCYGHNYRTGMLVGGESFMFRDCVDGTSNTMAVGEQAGNPRFSVKTDYMSGWSGGHAQHLSVTAANAQTGTPYALRTGITVIVGAPNPVSAPSYGSSSTHCNVPLTSFHTGGTQILLADGGVRFLGDNTNALICRKLAVKDDGLVLGEW